MQNKKYLGIRVNQEIFDYFKEEAENNLSTIAMEVRKVLLHYIRDIQKEKDKAA